MKRICVLFEVVLEAKNLELAIGYLDCFLRGKEEEEEEGEEEGEEEEEEEGKGKEEEEKEG